MASPPLERLARGLGIEVAESPNHSQPGEGGEGEEEVDEDDHIGITRSMFVRTTVDGEAPTTAEGVVTGKVPPTPQ